MVTDWMRRRAADLGGWIVLEDESGQDLRPHAHELNRVEPVWSHLKRSLANLARSNLAELTALVKSRLKRMQYRPAPLEGFLASSAWTSGPSVNPAIRDL